jgi:hypothetical protein
MAENPRQETELSFGGKTYSVRPTFQIITSIEAALNQPARFLGMKCFVVGKAMGERYGAEQEISMGELAVIVFWMLRDQFLADKAMPQTPAAVGEIMMEDGYGQLLMPVGEILTRAQKGNREHAKEAAAAIETARIAAEQASKGGDAAEAAARPPAPTPQD